MALAKSVQNGEMTTTIRLIATGADVTSKWGEDSLLQLANRAEQPLQATILTLHGAKVAENPSPYLCSRHRRQGSFFNVKYFGDRASSGKRFRYCRVIWLYLIL